MSENESKKSKIVRKFYGMPNEIIVTCSTENADFDELLTILRFQFFLGHFGILKSKQFSDPFADIFAHGSKYLTFYV